MNLTHLRYLGNLLLVLGHILLLNVDQRVGIVVKTLAFLLTMPYFLRHRLWDVVILSLAFCVIELTKLTTLLR